MRMKHMIRLVASDIDGTLIRDSTPDLYPEMEAAIGALAQKGILFCAASGRQYFSIQNVFRNVQEDMVIISENGAQVSYRGESISLTLMKREYAEEIVHQLRAYRDTCDMVVSTPKGSLIESKNKEFIDLLTYGYRNRFTLVRDVLEEDAEIIKIAMYQKESIRELGEGILIPQWKDRVKVCMAGEEWVDFMDASVDKGNALSFVQKYFGISREETMAFGDNNNDLGMMGAAAESYAVKNARKEVLEAARYVCPSWLDKGVWQVIRDRLLS